MGTRRLIDAGLGDPLTQRSAPSSEAFRHLGNHGPQNRPYSSFMGLTTSPTLEKIDVRILGMLRFDRRGDRELLSIGPAASWIDSMACFTGDTQWVKRFRSSQVRA